MQSDGRKGKPDTGDRAASGTGDRPPVQGSLGPPGEKPLSLALSRWRGDDASFGGGGR